MRLFGRLPSWPVAAGLLMAPLAVIATVQPAAAVTSPHASGPSGIRARGAELANAATGSVMWSRASATERPMGSITKVMTAFVVIEAGDLNREIKVPGGIIAYDDKYGASTAGLVPGNELTARQLLYALLIPSGCDAAYTLATAYGPGRSRFIAKMNADAAKLGLSRTHFTDFSGLPDPTETSTYSTPASLVKLGRDAMRLSLFRQIVRLGSYHIGATRQHRAYTWETTNPLIGSYPGAIGIKTGSTDAAGDCLLFEATRDKKSLIGVVLHSSTVSLSYAADDAIRMLNWGFAR